MFWIALIILVISILLFLLALFPTFIVDVAGLSGIILGGLDYVMQYSGMVCFFLEIGVVTSLLQILLAFKIIEWTYYVILYAVKIFK